MADEGNYAVTIIAENELGKSEKEITLEIKKDTVLLTPLMGFTSWNAFGFEVTAEALLNTAKRMDGRRYSSSRALRPAAVMR